MTWEIMSMNRPEPKRYMTHDDGSLFRFDNPGQYGIAGKTIRENYARYHRTIDSVADFKATLRAGPYAWPGGYPLFFITSDGGALSFESARECAYEIMHSMRHDIDDGWRVVACEANWEDTDLYCDHSGKPIESAYGED